MATYKKPVYTTTLTLTNGSTVTFQDVVADGNRVGTAARTQVLRHEAVHGTPTGEGAAETVVPYHAILKAEFSVATTDVEEAEDEFCVSETADDTDNSGQE